MQARDPRPMVPNADQRGEVSLSSVVPSAGPIRLRHSARPEGKKIVVVVGAGFAGLEVAKRLGNQALVQVLLLDQRNHHLFQPLLYQVATAGLNPADIAAPIRSQFKAATPKNLKELIALAKTRPGQLNYGTSGIASSNHMAGELLVHMAGIKINHVPYKGNAPAITDLIGGHIEMSISGVPVLVPHIKSERVRAVGIGSLKRFPAIPDVPTFDEQGLKGYEASTWFGLFAPAKTPRDIIVKLNAEVGKVLASKDIRERYLVEGLEPQGGSPEDFAKFVRSEIDLYARLAKAANLPKL